MNKYILFTHIHCYNINKFYEMFYNYIKTILKYFKVCITYSIGNIDKNLNSYFNINNIIILKIINKGGDIGGKFKFTSYLKNNNIKYDFCLFLHSKSNNFKRIDYFNKILNNIEDNILKLNNNIGIITFDILHIDNKDWGRNSYHMNNIKKK